MVKRTSPRLMGIVNVSPDSFSDGGQFDNVDAAVHYALALVDQGADILDIGGESTRPGADLIPEAEELARVLPVIDALHVRTECPLSIDTRKPEVALAAIEAGAVIWNDVSALTFSDDSMAIAARLDCEIVLMHAQGNPETMQDRPQYNDAVEEIAQWLEARVQSCLLAGIDRERLIVDPGIGFGKTLAHNLALLSGLERFQALGLPLLVGASRKRFIAAVDRDGPAEARLGGSLAAALRAANAGAHILRIHDVAQTRQALAVCAAIESTTTQRVER